MSEVSDLATWAHAYKRMQTYLYSTLYSPFLFRPLSLLPLSSPPSLLLRLLRLSPPSLRASSQRPYPPHLGTPVFDSPNCRFLPDFSENLRCGEMASTNTSNVYIHVIEDVINKVRDEFINNGGPGESVLNELQGVIVFLLIFLKRILYCSDLCSISCVAIIVCVSGAFLL